MAACVKFLRLNANCVEKCHLLILLVNFFLIRTSCKEDYYSILGIDRNANVEEIKRSYRRLAKEWLVIVSNFIHCNVIENFKKFKKC